jgi:hypothetical protein
MKFCLLIAASVTTLASVASAQLDIDFGQYGANVDLNGQPLSGSPNWTVSDAKTFIGYTYPVGGDYWGALGGYYDAPTNDVTTLSHPVNLTMSEPRRLFSEFFILSSEATDAITGLSFPNRDTFGFSFTSGAGSLLDLRFVPDTSPGNENLFNIFWGTNGSATTSSGWALYDDSTYNFNVDFAPDGADLNFVVTLSGTNTFSFNGTLPGQASQTWDTFDVVWELSNSGDAGSNAILLQGVSTVPEPSSAMGSLLAGMMGLSVATRRRRRA